MSPRRAKAIAGRAGDGPAASLRALLIDTAERLLAERQVSAITTRDIARAAGVSDGVLYNYFADKNELLLAALVQRYGRVAARFDVDLPTPGTATVEANLLVYARAALDLISGSLPIAAGLITDPPLLHRFIEAIHTEPFGPQRVRQPLADYLHGEQRLGRIPEVDVGAVFHLLFGATTVLAFADVMMGRQREHLSGQLPAIVGILARGLEPRPAP